MARFTVQLLLPDLAWDLLADLESILRSAKGRQSHGVEVLDHAGTFESADIGSARTESAKRRQPVHRITLAVKGWVEPGNASQGRQEYTVSVWASKLTEKAGATVNGHATGDGAPATSYAEDLLSELDGQAHAFLQHHYLPMDLIKQDQHRSEAPAVEAAPAAADAVPGSPARARGHLLWLITHQPLMATIVGSTIAGVLAAIIVAWLT